MAMVDILAVKSRIQKLKNKKADLTDDYSSISTINSAVGATAYSMQSFVGGSLSGLSKFESYKEPYQANDSTLTSAAAYIQREIDYLNKTLETLSVDNGGSCGGGGGGGR
jgi:hypothetical protein